MSTKQSKLSFNSDVCLKNVTTEIDQLERSNINPIGGDDVVISTENRDIVKN